MLALRYLAVSLLAVLSGILGNLLAAVIEGSLEQGFTPFQVAGMVVGILLAIVFSYLLQRRSASEKKEFEKLQEEIKFARRELRRFLDKHDSGVPWTLSDIENWQNHQRTIEELKGELRRRKADIQDDPIDYVSPPRLGCWIRTIELLKHTASLFAIPLILAISVGIAVAPGVQTGYLAYIATSTPDLTALARIATRTAEARGTAVAHVNATRTAEAQVQGTLTPTPTPTPTDTDTPTPTPTDAHTPTPTPTDTPVPPTDIPIPPTDTTVPPSVHWIYDGSRLAEGYDMGVNTSGGRTDWVRGMDGYMCMDYPSGQSWGAVFITVGPPRDRPRPGTDLSAYRTLSIELRGEAGGEYIWMGLKDNTDADNGKETKIRVQDLTTDWQTLTFPLSDFTTADLTRLYVVTEFVFEPGTPAETICFRRIQYLP